MPTVLTGKSVLKADVIDLLLIIIQAMNVSNEVNMEDFEATKINSDSDGDKNVDPTQGPSGLQKNTEVSKNTKVKFDPSNVCHFYSSNKCKFGKDCRKEHPKMCIKFKKFGLQKFNKNKNGCNDECEHYNYKYIFIVLSVIYKL